MESTIINLSIEPTFEILKEYFSDLCVENAKERVKAVKGNVVKSDVSYEILMEKYSIVWENVETGDKFTITLKAVTETSDTFLSWVVNDFVKKAVASISSGSGQVLDDETRSKTFISFSRRKGACVLSKFSYCAEMIHVVVRECWYESVQTDLHGTSSGGQSDGRYDELVTLKVYSCWWKTQWFGGCGIRCVSYTFFEMLGNGVSVITSRRKPSLGLGSCWLKYTNFQLIVCTRPTLVVTRRWDFPLISKQEIFGVSTCPMSVSFRSTRRIISGRWVRPDRVDLVRSVRAQSAKFQSYFIFSCFNCVAQITRTPLASLTLTARKSLENLGCKLN